MATDHQKSKDGEAVPISLQLISPIGRIFQTSQYRKQELPVYCLFPEIPFRLQQLSQENARRIQDTLRQHVEAEIQL